MYDMSLKKRKKRKESLPVSILILFSTIFFSNLKNIILLTYYKFVNTRSAYMFRYYSRLSCTDY